MKKLAPFLLFIWIGLIFGLSSIPNLETNWEYDFILRRIAHILEFAILTFILIVLFQPKTNRALTLIVIIAFLCALFNEYYQTFIPTRGGCLRDVGFDSISILIIAGVWWYIKIRKNK